jgi:amidase
LNAFCKDSEAYLPGAASGPLSGLSFAAKDIFDVAGHVTGGGNPDWKATHQPAGRNAWVVEALTKAGATMAGKTLTDELTRGIFGENVHYGTPTNPRAPGHVPGGSSSGSASAVAGGLVDFALGSDTGGSVRVPASFCGLYGLRPTHGRIHLDGILLQAPSFDTIGWFARDIQTFALAGSVLLGSQGAPSRPGRLIIAQDAFELAGEDVVQALRPLVDVLRSIFPAASTQRLAPNGLAEWSACQQVLQGREAWRSVKDWIEEVNPRFSFEVSERYTLAKAITDQEAAAAAPVRRSVVDRMDQLLAEGAVVCLPTTVSPAPLLGQRVSERHALRLRNSQLTSIAGLSGLPQLSLPLMEVDGKPVGFSLMGARGSDDALIALAREFEAALAH